MFILGYLLIFLGLYKVQIFNFRAKMDLFTLNFSLNIYRTSSFTSLSPFSPFSCSGDWNSMYSIVYSFDGSVSIL